MWTDAADSGELAAALIPAVWTFLGVVVVTLGTIAVQALKSRSDRTTSSSPAPSTDSAFLIQFAKEQGAVVQRLDDHDETIDLQDRRHERHDDRLDALERYNHHRDPEWRRR